MTGKLKLYLLLLIGLSVVFGAVLFIQERPLLSQESPPPTPWPSPTPWAFSGQPDHENASRFLEEKPRNIILIGWDGAQRDHVNECLNRGELPNIEQLGSEGAMVEIYMDTQTDTSAGWAEILTGYGPNVTSAYGNTAFGVIPRGYTIFERLEQYFGSENFVTVMVAGKDRNTGGEMGQLYYKSKESMDVFINGLHEDEEVGAEALLLLEKYKDEPFFFFIHEAEVDEKGHWYGENSKQYNDALIYADEWTGRIMDKLKELNIYDDTLIYVTSDHGFNEGKTHHMYAPYVFLATNDPAVVRGGMRVDITPTLLMRFGMDLDEMTPPLNGSSLLEPEQ